MKVSECLTYHCQLLFPFTVSCKSHDKVMIQSRGYKPDLNTQHFTSGIWLIQSYLNIIKKFLKYFKVYISGKRQNKNSFENKTKPTLPVFGHYVSSLLLLAFPAVERNLFGVILERFLSFQHDIGPQISILL